MTRLTSRPNLTSHGCSVCPERTLATSSASAVRSGGTGSLADRGAADRPEAPHTYASKPAAAWPALCETVTVLDAPSRWCRTRWLTSAGPASAVTAVTGPRAAHSSEITCGERSHSAPFSRRHGVLNGLDSSSDDPNHDPAPPSQPPRAVTSASQERIAAWNLRVKKTTDATWLRVTASQVVRLGRGERDGLFQQQ